MKLSRFFCSVLCCVPIGFPTVATAANCQTDDVLIDDFEGKDYGDWKVSGQAFGDGPAQGTLPGQMHVDGYQGNGLVNSFVGGDDTTGELVSPEFKIQRNFINFLVGGGQHPETTCIQLLVDGEIVETCTGPNGQAGGSERLDWQFWDVAKWKGKSATIRIVDQQKGGWGHINIDHIVQSDTAAKPSWSDQQREVVLEHSRLLLPISNGAQQKMVEVLVDGKLVHKLDVNLAEGQPDWWAYLDVQPWQGKNATIKVQKLQKDSKGLDQIKSGDSLPDGGNLYDETLRPQLRLSQQRGWNNDPNGMVYFNGQYHMFWQSNPAGWDWSNMYWGHAVSDDLIHWSEQPHALYPYLSAEKLCFSGSGHIDQKNTGGWQVGDTATMLFPFTDTGSGEALIISRDGGKTFESIAENPIIEHQGRDPKLVWYAYEDKDRPLNEAAKELGGHWVIAVYDEAPEHGQNIAFYVSTDLKNWEFVSRNKGFFECPELFRLAVDGDNENQKWVMFAADARYVIGDFDGLHFEPDHSEKLQVHHGQFYASQCFSNSPDGRVIQIGWARVPMPGMPFNQTFSLPINLELKSTAEGIRLFANPVEEVNSLRGPVKQISNKIVSANEPVSVEVNSQLLDIELELELGDVKRVQLSFGGNTIEVDAEKNIVWGMPYQLRDGVLKMRLIVDRPMFELVLQDGASYLTDIRIDGGKPLNSVQIKAVGGEAKVRNLKLYEMKSIWK